jgi:hypothetical protein
MDVFNFYLEVLAMTELRKRMIECLQLRGLSERTQESYVRAEELGATTINHLMSDL